MKSEAKKTVDPPSKNQYKALYQLTRKKRVNPNNQMSTLHNAEDSLQKYTINSGEKSKVKIQNHHIKLSKKSLHTRSYSCPFMNIDDLPVQNLKIIEDESRRTLKKISVPRNKKQRYFGENHNAHHRYKNNIPLQHKYSGSQLSQETNTVVVHPLPIEQLSSMLYSMNHEKEPKQQCSQNPERKVRNQKNEIKSPNFLKKVGLGKSSCHQHPKKCFETPSFPSNDSKFISCLHGDLYFKTKFENQIKLYNLAEDMKKLEKETENVRIRQQVLEKLAAKFEDSNEELNSSQNHEDSLLIH